MGGGVGTALGGTAVSYALATGGAVAGTSSSMIGTALNSNGNAGFSEYMLSGGFGGAMGGLNAVGSIAGLGSGLIGAGIGAQYGNASLGFQIGDMAGGIVGGGIDDFGRAIGKGALHWGAIGHAARRIGVEGGFTLGGGAVGYAATGTMDGALMGASMGQAIGGAFANFAVACFTAGTPLVVDMEGNSRPIDEIEVGDFVLARSEFDPDGPLELKRVEEKFVRTAVVMELVVHGQSIKTTAEHPFYVPAQGKFVAAGELQVGEQLVGHAGKLVEIESIGSTDEVTTVYNLRVADFHTYFVGGGLWGFDVWVHNASYSLRAEYLGATPGKYSSTGLQVQARMKASGDLRIKNGVIQIRYTAADATRGKWYDLDQTVDMAHITDAVTWWNSTGYIFGAKSKEVREWMLNPDNYILQPQSINRADGARLRATYNPPVNGSV